MCVCMCVCVCVHVHECMFSHLLLIQLNKSSRDWLVFFFGREGRDFEK